MNCRIDIRGLSLKAHLGCSLAEKKLPQEVRVSLQLLLAQAPAACESDELKDTLCYAKICEHIKEIVASQSFNTVERMAAVLVAGIRPKIPKGTRLRLEVLKVSPPVKDLLDGAAVILEDFLEDVLKDDR